MRSSQASHGSQGVATPIWNSCEIYRARLSTKKLCTAHQERWTTFLRVPLHHKACQTWFRRNLFVGFFEVTRELRQRRLWETFLDHATLSGPRVQIGRTMSELGPSRTILASLQSIVNQPPCCSQVPNRRSKRTQGNGTCWRSTKGPRIISELSSCSVFSHAALSNLSSPEGRHREINLELWLPQSAKKLQLDTREALLDTALLELAWPTQAGADQRTNRQ